MLSGIANRRKDAGAETTAEQLQSAGVDCGGFVMRVASYKVNGQKAYLIGAADDDARDEMGADRVRKYYPPIFTNDTGIDNYMWNIDSVNLLVPGDVIWVRNQNANGSWSYHMVMVRSIAYTGNTRIVEEQNVSLIEATTYAYSLKVQNTQKFDAYSGWMDYS